MSFMRSGVGFVLILSVLVLQACASLPVCQPSGQGGARVVFYKASSWDSSLNRPAVTHNACLAGRVAGGKALILDVAPGNHVFGASSMMPEQAVSKHKVELDVLAGETHFIRLEKSDSSVGFAIGSDGVTSGVYRLRHMPPEDAISERPELANFILKE